MMNNRETLGFIGIGLMGEPMTLRLLQAGYGVHVWNRSIKKMDTVIEAGARACRTVSDLVRASDVILLCLSDSAAVEAVVNDGVMQNGQNGKLLIDLSSIDPITTRNLAAKLSEACGMGWVDAPVSGGVAGAVEGNLAIMAGGTDEDVRRARIVLAPLYRQLTHMGEVGSGQITKICNQMIVGCNVLVIAEMMAMAKQAGVDVEKIAPALAGGFADSRPLQIIGPEMASECFEPVKWRVKTLLKDLSMAVDLAASQGKAVPMSGLAAELMRLHGSRGFLEQDPATLIRLYADL